MNAVIKPSKNLRGTITVPGDKSISHRSVMLGSIADGDTKVSGFLTGEDCLSTIDCFKKLGIDIEVDGTNVIVHGKGLRGLSAPTETLNVGNSGTTLRLMSGLLSAQPFTSHITGDSSCLLYTSLSVQQYNQPPLKCFLLSSLELRVLLWRQ